MSKNSARKRAAELMEFDEDQQEDEEEEESSSSSSLSVEEEQEPVVTGEPSRDMFLRSGKRKRRRSKETTGFTPPEPVAKKARKVGRKSEQTITKSKANGKGVSEDVETEDMANNHIEYEESTLRKISGRESLVGADDKAVVRAQNPEVGARYGDLPNDNDDTNRRLFDAKPPPMLDMAVPQTVTGRGADEDFIATRESVPQHQEPHARPIPEEALDTNGDHQWNDVLGKRRYLWRLFFFMFYLFLLHTVCTLLVTLAERLSDVREPPLPDHAMPETPVRKTEALVDGSSAQINLTKNIIEGIESLKSLQGVISESQVDFRTEYAVKHRKVQSVQLQLKNLDVELKTQSRILGEANAVLSALLKGQDPSAPVPDDARRAVGALGQKLLDTPSVALWEIAEPRDCSEGDAEVGSESETDAVLLSGKYQEPLSDLMLRVQMSVDKLIKSSDFEDKVRSWIRGQIKNHASGNDVVQRALSNLTVPQKRDGMENFEDLLLERLEIEAADRTGKFDHASILNGAQVIFGGKWGTSKSLIDSLPLYNRLMHMYKLRFYGYGPEAALTPTYPINGLGQCWSFQQTPIKDLLKRRHDDKNKRGNFGTLTISLPNLVNVRSVVIEHLPQGITDQINSAIRAFRVIGYEDQMAMGKSWFLGSFEYSILEKNPLQEFEVAADVYGSPIPPLGSISLAIDSNWGFDYACLYRFRVHGESAL